MKTRFGLAAFGVVAFGLAGCGGASASRAKAADSYGGAAESAPLPEIASETAPPPPVSVAPTAPAASPVAPAPLAAQASEGAAEASMSSPPATSSPPPRSAEVERAPSKRPGLGTEWGETRFSQVHEEPFTRADRDPFALAAVRYDDRAGVAAMTARQGGGAHATRSVSLASGWVTLSVRGEHGSPLDALHIGDRTYVVGRAGERYTILLSNRTDRRFEAVATVDGLDVINGQAGSLANRGYLIEPHGTLEIDGFRQSDDTVAAFRFGRVADSYAAKTGSARDVGVIGVALFADQRDRAREEEARLRESATPFPNDPRYAQPPPY
jgi:hypothetical protein